MQNPVFFLLDYEEEVSILVQTEILKKEEKKVQKEFILKDRVAKTQFSQDKQDKQNH